MEMTSWSGMTLPPNDPVLSSQDAKQRSRVNRYAKYFFIRWMVVRGLVLFVQLVVECAACVSIFGTGLVLLYGLTERAGIVYECGVGIFAVHYYTVGLLSSLKLTGVAISLKSTSSMFLMTTFLR